ncbi:MAG: hypothetical protein ACR2RF_09595 [Geminicoccaceae bacterium]
MTTPMTATRLDEFTERRVAASVKRKGISRSDWLRQAALDALEAEAQTPDQTATLSKAAKRLESLERSMCEIQRAFDENSNAIKELTRALAIERAADRAVAQQIYRMALRGSLLCVKIIADGVPEDERAGLGAQLSRQADDVYEEAGLARLDQVMRDAREEVRQSIERAGAT